MAAKPSVQKMITEFKNSNATRCKIIYPTWPRSFSKDQELVELKLIEQFHKPNRNHVPNGMENVTTYFSMKLPPTMCY